MLREQALSLLFDMEVKAARLVTDLMPGCELTSQSLNLAIRLCLFLDIKDVDYYVMKSLMIVMTFDELKIEEVILSEEFSYSIINQTCTEFCRIVLIRMKKEAKDLQVDLKHPYLDEANIYNMTIPDDKGDIPFSPISVGLSLVVTKNNLLRTS